VKFEPFQRDRKRVSVYPFADAPAVEADVAAAD